MAHKLYLKLRRRFKREDPVLSRREFLQTSLAATAGLLLSSCVSTSSRSGSGRPRVIVIGAGFAGLACAYELSKSGYEVLVLEARNRVGGRVLSLDRFVNNRILEGGAELIGSNHPTWVAYALKFGLKFLDVTEDENKREPLMLSGKLLGNDEAEALWAEMETVYKSMTDEAAPIDENSPWSSPNAKELDQKPTGDWIRSLNVSERCKRIATLEFAGDNATAVDRQSFLGNLSQVKGGGLDRYWTDSEVYRCQGGNQKLAEKLAQAMGVDRLKLNKTVRDIFVQDHGVEIRLNDGTRIEGDDVVLTVPPSVWHRIRFTPALPADLKPQTGIAVKYLAAVKKRFWEETGLSPNSYSDGMISMTWEGTDHQPGGENVVLTSFSGGPAAESCRQSWKEHGNADYQRDLEILYPGYRENYLKNQFMNWPSDPWALCGYSFPAPGEITTMGPTLQKGLGRLHFAGEYHCYKFVGYMEGALNSGASLARRIAERDGIVKPQPAAAAT